MRKVVFYNIDLLSKFSEKKNDKRIKLKHFPRTMLLLSIIDCIDTFYTTMLLSFIDCINTSYTTEWKTKLIS